MNYIIRRAKPEDSKEMFDAHKRSIREICSKDYRPEQIEAWAGFQYIPEHWPTTMQKDYVWVVVVEGRVQGFGHFILKSVVQGIVGGLYFAPEVTGLGAGKKILQEMFTIAQDKKLEKITLDATKTAKKFYELVGFKQISDVKMLSIRGQEIESVPMEKCL